ncbi:MAG: hypothetical protein ACREH8_03205 [Opitutaceae bacterium]
MKSSVLATRVVAAAGCGWPVGVCAVDPSSNVGSSIEPAPFG